MARPSGSPSRVHTLAGGPRGSCHTEEREDKVASGCSAGSPAVSPAGDACESPSSRTAASTASLLVRSLDAARRGRAPPGRCYPASLRMRCVWGVMGLMPSPLVGEGGNHWIQAFASARCTHTGPSRVTPKAAPSPSPCAFCRGASPPSLGKLTVAETTESCLRSSFSRRAFTGR